MLVLFVSALLMKVHGISGGTDFGAALLIALESMVPGVRVDSNLTYVGRIIGLVLKVLGPALLALTVLAVRNRVRR